MKKKIVLTPDAFKQNENGEVVINSKELAESMMDSLDDTQNVGEQGIKITVSI